MFHLFKIVYTKTVPYSEKREIMHHVKFPATGHVLGNGMWSVRLRTSWTEEEDVGSVEMAVEFVGGGHLSVGKGGEHFIIGWTQISVNVIK